MTDLNALQQEAETLRTLVEGQKLQEAKPLLTKLKIALTTLSSLPPSSSSSPNQEECLVARHILESATILSLLSHDTVAFERHFLQLKVFYHVSFPLSSLQFPLLGTRLLQLLVENRMAEFHNELEMLSESNRKNSYIAFTIQLEQDLMEGSYHKVLQARTTLPHPLYSFFLSQLMSTVRELMIECMEMAYPCLKLVQAQKMLLFDSLEAFQTYYQENKPEWKIQEEYIWFKTAEKRLGAMDIPSLKLVGETLAYATELDRIV